MTRLDADSTLFVYGSLLDAARRAALLGRRVPTVSAVLRDYAVFRARHFYVAAQPRAITPGLLLLGLGERDFSVLDRYEELPRLYTREAIEVEDQSGAPQRCWIYLPTARTLHGR